MVDYKRKPVLWIEGTRCLSNPERGVYADLVERMYALEADLYYDERDLAGFCNVTVRTFRKILQGLIDKGKIHVTEDGKLTANHVRTERETAMNIRETYRSLAVRGGKRSGEVRKNNSLTEAHASSSPSPSPSPSPSSKKESLTTFGAPPPNGGAPPCREIDPAKVCFQTGRDLLARYGVNSRKAGALIGKWRKVRSDSDLTAILLNAGKAERFDIVAFIEGSLRDQVDRPRSFAERKAEKTEDTLQSMLNGEFFNGHQPKPSSGNHEPLHSLPGSSPSPGKGRRDVPQGRK